MWVCTCLWVADISTQRYPDNVRCARKTESTQLCLQRLCPAHDCGTLSVPPAARTGDELDREVTAVPGPQPGSVTPAPNPALPPHFDQSTSVPLVQLLRESCAHSGPHRGGEVSLIIRLRGLSEAEVLGGMAYSSAASKTLGLQLGGSGPRIYPFELQRHGHVLTTCPLTKPSTSKPGSAHGSSTDHSSGDSAALPESAARIGSDCRQCSSCCRRRPLCAACSAAQTPGRA